MSPYSSPESITKIKRSNSRNNSTNNANRRMSKNMDGKNNDGDCLYGSMSEIKKDLKYFSQKYKLNLIDKRLLLGIF